ncbi:uncharacterized protein [Ptychodera flava]|uniref:uncharacterized protein n=1 Tax=Ptychodera flava TaxID=63121 RepID=UPI00396A535A
MVSQFEDFDRVEGNKSQSSKKKGGIFRIFRAFSGKKTYDHLGSTGDIHTSFDTSRDKEERQVDPSWGTGTKKEGFLRRSFRRSKRRKGHERFRPRSEVFSQEETFTPVKFEPIVCPGHGKPTDGNSAQSPTGATTQNVEQKFRSTAAKNQSEKATTTLQDSGIGEDVDAEVASENVPASSTTEKDSVERSYCQDGDLTQIKEVIKEHSNISDRLLVADGNIQNRERKTSETISHAADEDVVVPKKHGIAKKVGRRLSFQKKGIVRGYSDLDESDPVEVAARYTPFPDMSKNTTEELVTDFGKENVPSSLSMKRPIEWTKKKVTNYSSGLSGQRKSLSSSSFDEHDDSKSPTNQNSISKLSRRVSFNAKSVVSKYSDLNNIDDEDVFFDNNAESEHKVYEPYREIPPGPPQYVHTTEFGKGQEKSADNWKFWQKNNTNTRQALQPIGSVHSNQEIADSTDDESMMSVSSGNSSLGNASASKLTRKFSLNRKSAVRNYQELDIPDESYETTDHPYDDYVSDVFSESKNTGPGRTGQSKQSNHTTTHYTKILWHKFRQPTEAEDSHVQSKDGPTNTVYYTSGKSEWNDENHHRNMDSWDSTSRPTTFRNVDETEQGSVDRGYVGLKSWTSSLKAGDETVDQAELQERLGDFGRQEPKQQSQFRKVFKKTSVKKHPAGERF